MDEDLYIPVDDAIREFRRHLLSHPRTILSAKYGDGKSFFLQEFEKDKKVQEKFVLLKLYPVNYQVIENKDIFNLIKYDLLFQLFDKGLLDATQEISSLNLFYTYIRSKDKDIIQFLCEMAAVVGLLPKQFGSIIDKADQLKKKWEQYKDGNGNAELSNFYNRVGGQSRRVSSLGTPTRATSHGTCWVTAPPIRPRSSISYIECTIGSCGLCL